MLRTLLEDIVKVVGRKVTSGNEFVHTMSADNPDLLLAGVGIPSVSKNVINAGNKLKAIICCSNMGANFVDLKAATERGVFVVNVPDFVQAAVAEYASARAHTKEATKKAQRLLRMEISRIVNGEIPRNLVNTRVLELENPSA
jgi:phosphoglycerate dehydrogenase-like enzyme